MALQHLLDHEVDLLDRDVVVSNALIRSALRLSLFEKRLIQAALAKLGKQPWPKHWDHCPATEHRENWEQWLDVEQSPFSIRITAADYAAAANVEMSTAYTQLKDASEKLFKREIAMRVKTTKGVEVDEFRWLSRRKYHDREGYVEIYWSFEVAPYIYNLKGNFTLYKLRQTASLDNDHAIRLFQLFASFAPGKGVFEGRYAPTIEEFNHAMEVPECYHGDFAGIRRRVIEKAVSQLAERLELHIEWDAKKRGKKVIGLEFRFAPAKQNDQTLLGQDTPDEEDEQ